MDVEFLRYQVQKIDGTPSSIKEAIEAVLSVIKTEKLPLPKSVEHHFFEETSRSILDWMGKGMNKTIRETLDTFDNLILTDPELAYPLANLDSKKRVAAMISFLSEIMSIYLRADLEWKDEQINI